MIDLCRPPMDTRLLAKRLGQIAVEAREQIGRLPVSNIRRAATRDDADRALERIKRVVEAIERDAGR